MFNGLRRCVSLMCVVVVSASALGAQLNDFYNPQDFRGDAKKKFKVWPYIPFFRAADLDNFQEAHGRTRKETMAEYMGYLERLIKASGDIDKSLKALLVLDKIYEQHRKDSLRGLPLTLGAEFKATLDSIYRVQRIPYRKLGFVSTTNTRDIIENLTTYVSAGQVPMGEWDYGEFGWHFDNTFNEVVEYRTKPQRQIPYNPEEPPVDIYMYGTYTIMPVKRRLETQIIGKRSQTWRSRNGRDTYTEREDVIQKDENAEPARIKVTLTMVKLATGETESFHFTGTPSTVMAPLAYHVFKYFQGRRHVPYDVVKDYMWLPQAPGHVGSYGKDKLVNYRVAKRTCARQGARLPFVEEIEDGIADGEFFEGLDLDDSGWGHYFIDSEQQNIGKVSYLQETLYFNPGARSGDPVQSESKSSNIVSNYRCIKDFRN